MKHQLGILLAAASLVAAWPAHAQYAGSIVHYAPGTGYAVEFGSGEGYTNTPALLGPPSRTTTDGDYISDVDPFAPPYTKAQLLSLGALGTVTLKMDSPILNDPANPFGLDFLLFGNTGFLITNGNFSGGGITSGFIFGGNAGQTRVSVSADGTTFYALDPALAPNADNPFPPDAAGDPLAPVNPALTAADFAGLDLPGIRKLYAGSGGGTGFDLAWARDAQGLPVVLPRADFIRIDVISGKSELDAVSAVLARPPGPGFTETFADTPTPRGWAVHGDPSLFRWDPERGALDVTWDSSRTNSYFHHALGTTVTAADDFTSSFDVTFDTIRPGSDPAKPSAFQLAFGLFDFGQATRPDFFRGTGVDAQHGPRSVVEWNYFPDTGFGTTLSPTIFASNNVPEIAFTFPFDLNPGVHYRVTMAYTASNRVLRTSMLANGVPMAAIKEVTLPDDPAFDFRLDTVAVASYSDAGQAGDFAGSLFARGWIDNIRVTLPPEFVMTRLAFKDGTPEVKFEARKNWTYTLERTSDWKTWQTAGTSVTATRAGQLALGDTLPAAPHAAYRVRASLP